MLSFASDHMEAKVHTLQKVLEALYTVNIGIQSVVGHELDHCHHVASFDSSGLSFHRLFDHAAT